MKINHKIWIKHEKFHLVFLSLFQGRKEVEVKVFCFCDALWSWGDNNSFYPFLLKCEYDNSLQEENVHFLTFSKAQRLLECSTVTTVRNQDEEDREQSLECSATGMGQFPI